MPIGEAAQHFSLLTIGDGLAAQIPALLISVAAASSSRARASESDLGTDVAGQLMKQRKAPMVAGVVICAFALVPGLPKLPFLVVGALFILVGARCSRPTSRRPPTRRSPSEQQAALPAPGNSGDQAREALQIDPLELEIGYGLVNLVDASAGGRCSAASAPSAARSRASSAS